jgi:hypothetical protein
MSVKIACLAAGVQTEYILIVCLECYCWANPLIWKSFFVSTLCPLLWWFVANRILPSGTWYWQRESRNRYPQLRENAYHNTSIYHSDVLYTSRLSRGHHIFIPGLFLGTTPLHAEVFICFLLHFQSAQIRKPYFTLPHILNMTGWLLCQEFGCIYRKAYCGYQGRHETHHSYRQSSPCA